MEEYSIAKNKSFLMTPALVLFIDGQTSIPSFSLSIVYLIFYFISTILVIFALRVSFIVGSYHWNLKRLYCCSILSWFSIGTSKLLVIYAQLYHFDNKNKIFDETGDIILHISALLRYEFCYFFIVNLFSVILERSFATFFIRDYEKKKRTWIFYILFIFGFTFSTVFSFLTVMRIITIYMLVIYVLSFAFSTLIGFSYLVFRNSRRLKYLTNYHRNTVYTLSIKYQLRENINTLKSMKQLTMVAVGAIFCVATAYILPLLLNIPSKQIWIFHTFIDIFYHFNPLYMIPACLLSIPQNLLYLKKLFASKNASKQNETKKFANEGDVYFNMFQKSMTTSKSKPLPAIIQVRQNSGTKISCAPFR
ncbi:unnamed protein product [Caenorhabditis angaria]|uniref:Uncharacterized protein n=1 Tax=Caenorhabditis angaria TaxID=860376 RepID=A0A9P1IVX7_9PELO|nr:unnamed protein product [Caenorhabditis angaria]